MYTNPIYFVDVFQFIGIIYKALYAHNILVTRVCALVACAVYILNKRGNNLLHVTDFQYVLNIPLISGYSHVMIPPCILLGIVITGIINGTPGLATGRTEAAPAKEVSVPKPSTSGARHPR